MSALHWLLLNLALSALLSEAPAGLLMDEPENVPATPQPVRTVPDLEQAGCPPNEAQPEQRPPKKVVPPASKPAAERIEHLIQAAIHLDAAGDRRASQVRESANQLRKEIVLVEKRDQLKRLQAEIAELEGEVGIQRQVLLQLSVFEVDLGKLSAQQPTLAAFWSGDGSGVRNTFQFATRDQQKLEAILRALVEQKAAKVVAEPHLVTMSGHPASFQIGGKMPLLLTAHQNNAEVKFRDFGTRIDCLPELLPNGNFRIELQPSVTELDGGGRSVIDQLTIQGVRRRQFRAAVEMEPGETLVVGGIENHAAGGKPSKALCLMVRATAFSDNQAETPQDSGPTETSR